MTSLWQKWSQDAAHAFQDMYGNLVLGDDAGQSAKLVVVVNSSPKDSSSVGVTFCEINGRAYVQSVEPSSRAAQAGVLARDCVQYAAVLASEWRDPLGEDFADIRKHALEREESGQRISYKELKALLQTGVLVESAVSASCLAPRAVPTTIQVGGTSNPCGPLGGAASRNYTRTTSGDGLARTTEARPVVLVFRRTKQRPSTLLPIWPHYRLDDECDVACQILQSLATSPPKVEAASVSSLSSTEETVEAATIRAMIQNALGLAFLRSNKVVLGVSVHAGSGIVIARLPDGTWSAPSAIGIAGMGLGLQLGIEVAHSILILQTKEALEHFQRGGSFTVGANVGAAVGGVGREAIGAASLSGVFCGSQDPLMVVKDDEYHADILPPNAQSSVGVAPLVAYAKSQGLYVGLSLEGSRIHGRNDVNARTYQFDTRKPLTAHDLLTGKVPPPPEADKLYEALHQVEFTHELQSLPRPPKALWGRKAWYASAEPLDLSSIDDQSALQNFERMFREFLYGGIYVWRIGGQKRERRTLWLCVPEGSASLQLGFVSKLSNVEAKRTGSNEIDDRRSVASEEVTLDSALMVSSIRSIENRKGLQQLLTMCVLMSLSV
jgi:lipid-binding SYLF domain-containing protein